MRVLVLGNSDTAGLFSGGKTWTAIVQTRLAELISEEIDLKEIPFSVLGQAAPGYAEKKVREVGPELVILPVGTYPWSIGFVWKRVERLLGKRAGRRYKRLEDSFDTGTRNRGALRQRANRSVRSVARRIIGTEPLATRQETTDAFRQVIAAIARVQNTQLVLVAYGQRGRHHFRGRNAEHRQQYVEEVGAAAREHHFTFLDAKAAYEGISPDVPTTTPDGFHQNQYGHELLGEFVARGAAEVLGARA